MFLDVADYILWKNAHILSYFGTGSDTYLLNYFIVGYYDLLFYKKKKLKINTVFD